MQGGRVSESIRPLIAISTGDPAGIGPEITAKALSLGETYELCRPLAVADLEVMKEAIRFSGLSLEVNSVDSPERGKYEFGTIDVLDLDNVDLDELKYGTISGKSGQAAFEYISKVIELALEDKVDATVTGPIHKESIAAAGYHYAGHTEIYSDLTDTKDYTMMLADGDFRVVHVSTHVSLREALDLIEKERIIKVVGLADEAMKRIGIAEPKIAVAGLNPHCGERGLFGTEEMEIIGPAVEEANEKGFNVDGPIPADTVFPKMLGGQYDVVVCMYHDQGHIPVKLVGFEYDEETGNWLSVSGVNVTLGLPIIRTSVDHGVAFGKAGEGRANEDSMVEAIRMAIQLSTTG